MQLHHYTWSGTGGVREPYSKVVDGYRDVGTGKYVYWGNGGQPKDYDITLPTTGGIDFGASPERVNTSNNAYALDMKRDTGRGLSVGEAGTKGNERVARLIPAVKQRLVAR